MLPLLRLLIIFPLSFRRLKLVACIKPTSHLPMVHPRTQAQPAKFVAALGARHVHAAMVFLNGALALGAWFGVGQDPVEVF